MPAKAESLKDVPALPGVYLYKDGKGAVLYVGKAKHLRKRLASYLRPGAVLTTKTRAMLDQAVSIDLLVTETEKEALLLEASLIKKHKPRYNVALRDDKQYVLFKLDKNSDYPRLFLTRKVGRDRHDKATYYGPFTSARSARETLKAMLRIFPLRRCKDTVFKNRVRPCLYHQIKLCLGPCSLDVPGEHYARLVSGVEMLLCGRSGKLIEQLTREMTRAGEELRFEEAAELRDQIAAVKRTLEQQVVVLPKPLDMDVLGLAATDKGLGLGVLFVRQGRLLDKKSFFWPGLELVDGQEVLPAFMAQFYGKSGPGRFIPEVVLTPWDLCEPGAACDQEELGAVDPATALAEILTEERGGPVRIRPPKTGPEQRLVAMAGQNAREDALVREEPPVAVALQRALGMAEPPLRIEAVDVSHTRGQETKVGVVVFEDGVPAKDQYRVYNVQPETPGDDYGALSLWAARRVKSGPPWPDLLLVDGGRGQLASVVAALTAALADPPEELDRADLPDALWALAAIAKAREGEPGRSRRKSHALEDRIFLPGRMNPLPLKPGSPELLFLQRVRDAVHDFVIGRHRRARKKRVLESELLRLPGIGPKTARLLWDHFPSLTAMAQATEEELGAVPGLGAKRAKAVFTALQGLGRIGE